MAFGPNQRRESTPKTLYNPGPWEESVACLTTSGDLTSQGTVREKLAWEGGQEANRRKGAWDSLLSDPV